MNIDLSSLRRPVEERMKSPLLSSFVISWIGFNWKAVYTFITYSHIGVNGNKEAGVVQAAYSYFQQSHTLYYPASIALFFTFIYPYINTWIIGFTAKRRSEQVQAKYNGLGKDLVPGAYWLDEIENNKRKQKLNKELNDKKLKDDKTIQNLIVQNGRLEEETSILINETIELKDYKENLNIHFESKVWDLIIGPEKAPIVREDVTISDNRITLSKGEDIFEIPFFKYHYVRNHPNPFITLMVHERLEFVKLKDEKVNLDKPELEELGIGYISIEKLAKDHYSGHYYKLSNRFNSNHPSVTINFYLKNSPSQKEFIRKSSK